MENNESKSTSLTIKSVTIKKNEIRYMLELINRERMFVLHKLTEHTVCNNTKKIEKYTAKRSMLDTIESKLRGEYIEQK